MITIHSPADERTVRNLELGQVVHIDGTIITGRDEMHMRALSSKNVPKELNFATLFHCGPIMIRDGKEWKAIAAGPTTSARMDTMEAEMIERFKIRIIIGKGGMSDDVLKAMKDNGCVYLAAIGGAAVSLAECLRCTGIEWEELGMAEAMWKFTAKQFGPLVVAMDAHGNSLYKNVGSKVNRTIKDHS
ncbi:MAG: FumA C-terminus/TtdB family hydratase beta subunit [Methanomassiliicoccaceae archaeon]|jgi:fumarate hydratase subunit beta|nr:FumA C-terminus/TtdB family hydratase beta subunit [Methanomassiliicoccaceae archaeon]